MSTYDKGDKVRLAVVIQVSSADTDPTALILRVKEPDSTITVSNWPTPSDEIVKDSTGNFHLDVTIAQFGKHHYRWEATGAAVGAEEAGFDTRSSRVV